MTTKLRVVIATSFENKEDTLPLGIWSLYAFLADGDSCASVSLVNKTCTIKQHAEDFVDELNTLRKELTDGRVIGGLTIDMHSKNYVIASFYEEYDRDVFTMSNTVLDEVTAD